MLGEVLTGYSVKQIILYSLNEVCFETLRKLIAINIRNLGVLQNRI